MSLLATDERIARRVGVIALLVIAASITFIVFFLDQLDLGSRTRIRVYFHHSAGLREKAPLVVAGQAIGEIESIETVPRGGTNPLGGEIGSVAMIAIYEGEAWKVSRKADIFVSSRGILSEKYLEVAPPSGDPGPAVVEGAELLAADPPSLDTVLQRTWNNMLTYKLFVEQVRPELELVRGEIANLRAQLALLPSAQPAVDDGGELLDAATALHDRALGGDAGLARLASMITRARATLDETRRMIDMLSPRASQLRDELARIGAQIETQDAVTRTEAVLGRVRAAIDKVDPLLAVVDDISSRMARGEGSLGRLMKDPEFPEDAKELGKILKRRPWRIIVKPRN